MRTKPHVFSWVIWGSTTFIVFLAQLEAGGGVGAWPIGISGLITLFIALLAFAHPYDEDMRFFALFALRNLLVIFALQTYSLATTLFPAVIAVVCLLFVFLIVFRRRAFRLP
ncbi:MAG: hypothetical protein ABW092_14785 [Candidatus Thiodiazotropha sp.]